MSGILEETIKKVMADTFNSEYTHLNHPGMVLCQVIRMDADRIATIKILDKSGNNEDPNYPEIPGIHISLPDVSAGDIVVAGMLYGDCRPYVLGRYQS